MKLIDLKVKNFTEELSSKEAVPGGGGASALVGALGCALGIMVTNLTIGKEKYKNFEDENLVLRDEITKIRNEMLDLIEEDANNFIPLSKAYSLPNNTPQEKNRKKKLLEIYSIKACDAPIRIIRLSIKTLNLLEKLVSTSSVLALSDIAVASEMIRSALTGGWINVLINLKYVVNNKSFLNSCNNELRQQVVKGKEKADNIYNLIQHNLENQNDL